MTHTDTHKGHPALLGLAVATAIAAGLGMFLRTEKGEDVREEVSDRAKKIAKRFNKSRKELQESIHDAFGEVNEELEAKYLELQGMLMAEADDTKDLTQEKYEEMVDKALKKYAKGREWTEDAVSKLNRSLKRDWNSLKQ